MAALGWFGEVRAGRASPGAAAVGLGGLGSLHAVWGVWSSWPVADCEALADAVIGLWDVLPAAACWAVAGALGAAAAFVGGGPRALARVGRTVAAGVVLVLTGRGLLGLVGRTDVVSPGSRSALFCRLDRQRYSPLCLALAALGLLAMRCRSSNFVRFAVLCWAACSVLVSTDPVAVPAP